MKMTDLTAYLQEKRTEAGSDAPLRVVICGEVNSGKSTVMNAVMRGHLLPDNIGRSERPLLVAGWREIPGIEARSRSGAELRRALPGDTDLFHDAEFARIWLDQPQLAGIELIELPMTRAEDITASEIRLIASADVLIWVTIGSQAWRLTEKGIVEAMGDARPERSILIVSRADKLRNDSDRSRLMERMERETADLFGHRLFLFGDRRRIAASAQSEEAWAESGGAALADLLRGFAGAGPAHPRYLAEFEEPEDAITPERTADAIAALTSLPDNVIPFPEEAVCDEEPAAEPALIVENNQEPDVLPPVIERVAPLPEPAPEPVPAPAAKPARPRRAAKTAQLAAGVVLAGFQREGEAPVALRGDHDAAADLARFCRQMLGALTATIGAEDEVAAFSLATAGRRVLFQQVPGAGLVFLLADAGQMNQGMAHLALGKLAEDPRVSA